MKHLTEHLSRYITKENFQMANMHMRTCLISLVIRKMHVKITVTVHSPPAMATIRDEQKQMLGTMGKKGNTLILCGNVKWYQTLKSSLSAS